MRLRPYRCRLTLSDLGIALPTNAAAMILTERRSLSPNVQHAPAGGLVTTVAVGSALAAAVVTAGGDLGGAVASVCSVAIDAAGFVASSPGNALAVVANVALSPLTPFALGFGAIGLGVEAFGAGVRMADSANHAYGAVLADSQNAANREKDMASRRPHNPHIQATGAHTLLVKWDHPRLPCTHIVEFTEGQVLWGNPFETVIGEGVSSFHLWDWNQTNRNGGDAPQELLKPNTKHRVRLCALHPESGLRSHWSDYTEASTSPAIPAEFTPTRTTPCELQQTFDAAEQELREVRDRPRRCKLRSRA